MNNRRFILYMVAVSLLLVFALGLYVRGPEATLDWILARFDMIINWALRR